MNFISAATTNFTKGRNGKNIELIIIHSIVGTASSAIGHFQNPASKVSAHYIVDWDGAITQMVKDEDTAYQAGVWDFNLKSIGIEHSDLGQPGIVRPDVLYQESATLVATLCQKYNIPCDRAHIKKHSEIKATACPAGLDIEKIVKLAQGLLTPTPQGFEYPIGVITLEGTNVRTQPTLDGEVISQLHKDQEISIENVVKGSPVLNNDNWVKLSGHDYYIWSGNVQIKPVDAPVKQEVGKETNLLNAAKVLSNAMSKLVSKNGQPFGNEEGMAREMVDSWPEYVEIKKLQKGGLVDKIISFLGLGR